MKKQYIALIVFLIFALLIFFNNDIPPVKFLVTTVQNIFSAPKSAVHNLRTKMGSSSTTNLSAEELKKQNDILTQKLLDYEKLKQDNEALRGQFETSEMQNYKLIPVRVIGFLGPFLQPTSLIIDQGESKGVKHGMAVIFKNNLVGKIGQTTSSYSEVILPVDLNFSTIGVTAEGNIAGVVNGQNDFILFDRVATDASIKNGELLLSRGDVDAQGLGVPPGIVIGRVVSVSRNQSLPFQNAKIDSMISFSHLQTVFVIKSL